MLDNGNGQLEIYVLLYVTLSSNRSSSISSLQETTGRLYLHSSWSRYSSSSPHGGISWYVTSVQAVFCSCNHQCLRMKNSLARELKGLDLQTSFFTLRQIKAATNNFDIAFKIGGGFGPVYKGILSDGTIVTVKQLSSQSSQGNHEFINEIGMISALKHPCLVKLYGCCMEGDQLLLIYEYMENNSLANALFVKNEGPEKWQLKLDWSTRQKICVGIARGLAYLHEESRLKIVHRDIKAINVLLDKDLNPKISDFGLAKLKEEDQTHISTRIAGTYFGVIALEIVSGKSNTIGHPNEEYFSLLDWVHLLKEKSNLMELVDHSLGVDFNKKEVMAMIKVALLSINVSPMLRPTMSLAVSKFEGRTVVQEEVPDISESLDDGANLF